MPKKKKTSDSPDLGAVARELGAQCDWGYVPAHPHPDVVDGARVVVSIRIPVADRDAAVALAKSLGLG